MSWLTALFTDTQSPAHAALIYSLVIALLLLSGTVVRLTREFFASEG